MNWFLYLSAKQILNEFDIDVEIYNASEIDEKANYVTKFRHPDVVQLGDIQTIVKNEKLIKNLCPINFLIGGSPCEELSKANSKGLGLSKSVFICTESTHITHLKKWKINKMYIVCSN